MKEKFEEFLDALFQKNMILPTIALVISIIALVMSVMECTN